VIDSVFGTKALSLNFLFEPALLLNHFPDYLSLLVNRGFIALISKRTTSFQAIALPVVGTVLTLT